MIQLENYESQCQPEQPKIVSQDKGSSCKHTAENDERCAVRHYQIDGNVINDSTTQKCDFLLLNDTKCHAYFIELKGKAIAHAIGQVDNTIKVLAHMLGNYEIRPRIIYKSKTQSIKDSKVISWQKRHHGRAKIKQGQLTEKI